MIGLLLFAILISIKSLLGYIVQRIARFVVEGNGYYQQWFMLEQTLRYRVSVASVHALLCVIFSRQFKFKEWVALGSGRCSLVWLNVVLVMAVFYVVPILAVSEIWAVFFYSFALHWVLKSRLSPVNPVELIGLLLLGLVVGASLCISSHNIYMGRIFNSCYWSMDGFKVWALGLAYFPSGMSALHYWLFMMLLLITVGVCRPWLEVGPVGVPRWVERIQLPVVGCGWLRPGGRRLVVHWAGRVDRCMVGSLPILCVGMFFKAPLLLFVWSVTWGVIYLCIFAFLHSDLLLYHKSCEAGWTGAGLLLVCKIIILLLAVYVFGALFLGWLHEWRVSLLWDGPMRDAWWLKSEVIRLNWTIRFVWSKNGFRIIWSVIPKESRRMVYKMAKRAAKKAAKKVAKGGSK